MSVPVVKFNVKDQTEFFKELRKRVNKYFKENNISRYANFKMKFKSAFMICLYFAPLVLMLTGVVANIWLVLLMWALMGFGMSGIGLSIMHDANHGSYSKNQKVNNAMGWLIHFIGGYKENWKIHEAALHGSSHFDLPPVLAWFTASIGIHHVHHLYSRIPFYRLCQVLKDHEELVDCNRMTLVESFKCAKLSLWDEESRKLVSFSEARGMTDRLVGI